MRSLRATVCPLLMRTSGLFPCPIHEMTYCQDRVSVKHARPGITHHVLDPVSHGWLETMDRTLGASCLPLLERALLKTLVGIDQEFPAPSAWSVTSMLAATVEIYHDREGLAFPGHSRVFLVHGQHILPQKPTAIHKIEQQRVASISESPMTKVPRLESG